MMINLQVNDQLTHRAAFTFYYSTVIGQYGVWCKPVANSEAFFSIDFSRSTFPIMDINSGRDASALSSELAEQTGPSIQSLHDKELGDLRAVIAQLLIQLEVLQQHRNSARTRDTHDARLRDANAHLVLATFDAQDSDGIGLGSTFTVLLPLNTSTAEIPPSQLPPISNLGPLQILLVEDNIDAAETLSLLLELRGHVVRPCHNGTDAVEMAQARYYDLIICDIGLPGIDGFTVVERIRAALPGKLPFFIATSGYNQPQDRERAIRSGFDHYLVKPVSIEILLALIELHVH